MVTTLSGYWYARSTKTEVGECTNQSVVMLVRRNCITNICRMNFLQRVPIVENEEVIFLSENEYKIGRGNKDKDLRIVLSGRNVSRKHLKLVKTIESKWQLIDTNSLVGTYINGEKIKSNILHTLNDEDIIGVGCPLCYSTRGIGETFVFQYNIPFNEQG